MTFVSAGHSLLEPTYLHPSVFLECDESILEDRVVRRSIEVKVVARESVIAIPDTRHLKARSHGFQCSGAMTPLVSSFTCICLRWRIYLPVPIVVALSDAPTFHRVMIWRYLFQIYEGKFIEVEVDAGVVENERPVPGPPAGHNGVLVLQG